MGPTPEQLARAIMGEFPMMPPNRPAMMNALRNPMRGVNGAVTPNPNAQPVMQPQMLGGVRG